MRFVEPEDILNWLPWAIPEMLHPGQVHYVVLCTGTTFCFQQILTVNTNELDVVFFSCPVGRRSRSPRKRIEGRAAEHLGVFRNLRVSVIELPKQTPR